MDTKICTKCHKKLPATTEYFHKDKLGRSGLKSSCKTCTALFRKEYYINNKEIENKRATTWNLNNRYFRLVYKSKYNHKIVKNLDDTYIAYSCLRMSLKDLTPEIIETQRNIIKIKRLCKLGIQTNSMTN